MAKGADQQGRAAASIGIGGSADVPPEPAVRLVAEELGQNRAGTPGAELDTTDPGGSPETMPGRADGDVVDAVAVEIAGIDDHPSELLARLLARPVPQLLAGGTGVDVNLPEEGPRLVLRCRRRHRDLTLAVAVEVAERRNDAAETTSRIRSSPVVQLLPPRRREYPAPAHLPALGLLCHRSSDGEIGAAIPVEIVEPSDVPSEGLSLRLGRVGPEHRSVLAAQEVDPADWLRRRTDEDVGATVAILISGERHVPSEALALGLHALPDLLAGLGRARHHDAAPAPVEVCMGRRDDDVREPVARQVRHGHHPVAEEPVGPLAVPLADQVTGRARPHRGGSVLLVPVPELEAGSGGDIGVAITVDVERLAEAEPELTAPDAPGEAPRHAPAGSGSGAGRRGARERRPRDRQAAEEGGGRGRRGTAAAARTCRRRQVLH